MFTKALVAVSIVFMAFSWPGRAQAAPSGAPGGADSKDYRVEGVITRISPDSVTIRAGGEAGDELHFARSKEPKGSDLHVGDKIIVWYTLDARKTELKNRAGRPEPQAGQKGEEGFPADVPGKIIRDDRIFQVS